MSWTEDDDKRVRKFCKTMGIEKLADCPKCGMRRGTQSELALASFCSHEDCAFREWRLAMAAAERDAALDAWKRDGGRRPATRPDGIPTRIDRQWMTAAELAIMDAVEVVERAGASTKLTDAVTLLSQARDRVADHVEAIAPEVSAFDKLVERLVEEAIGTCEPENADDMASAYTRSVLSKKFRKALTHAQAVRK
jgi:hypothetical protein